MNDLVVCSLEPWDDIWRRNQYLITGLLRRDPTLRVLFSEPSADPLYEIMSRRQPRRGLGVRVVHDLPGVEPGRLWRHQPTKVLPRIVGGDVDARLAASVERAARQLGLVDPVLWVNSPSAASVLRRTGWPALYDITDDWLSADRGDREHERLVADEAFLMEHCAAVTVCSPGLASTKGRFRAVEVVPNAVDLDRYRTPLPRPGDLPEGRVALYVGTVHTDRIDLDLCAATARQLALAESGAVVLVGPAPLAAAERGRLESAGVRLLGSRRYETVPAYLQHADVLIVPHVVDEFTDSLDPIKLYEYQAVGRPVVATPVAGFRDRADVDVAEASEFAGAVAARLADAPPPGVGPLRATVPTWDDRVEVMAGVLASVRG